MIGVREHIYGLRFFEFVLAGLADHLPVAGKAGGIPLQLENGIGGFLVNSVEECAERTLWLLKHPDEGRAMGAKGRQRVQERFLLPRLIAVPSGMLVGAPTIAAVGLTLVTVTVWLVAPEPPSLSVAVSVTT